MKESIEGRVVNAVDFALASMRKDANGEDAQGDPAADGGGINAKVTSDFRDGAPTWSSSQAGECVGVAAETCPPKYILAEVVATARMAGTFTS